MTINDIKVGDIFRHYKGQEYVITRIEERCDLNSRCIYRNPDGTLAGKVCYQKIKEPGTYYAMALNTFLMGFDLKVSPFLDEKGVLHKDLPYLKMIGHREEFEE